MRSSVTGCVDIMVDALVRVADYYRTGSKEAGVNQNFDRANRIYRLAATYGHPASQYALGMVACGLLTLKLRPIRSSTKSISDPVI